MLLVGFGTRWTLRPAASRFGVRTNFQDGLLACCRLDLYTSQAIPHQYDVLPSFKLVLVIALWFRFRFPCLECVHWLRNYESRTAPDVDHKRPEAVLSVLKCADGLQAKPSAKPVTSDPITRFTYITVSGGAKYNQTQSTA
jgi:hypothetical protein